MSERREWWVALDWDDMGHAVFESQIVCPDAIHVREVLPGEPSELDNHHNAVKCPYCNPDGKVLVDARLLAAAKDVVAERHAIELTYPQVALANAIVKLIEIIEACDLDTTRETNE